MRSLWAFVLLTISVLAHAVPGIQHGTNDMSEFVSGTFVLDVEDLRVKVQGGYVRSTRSYVGGGWEFNRRLAPIEVVEQTAGGARGGSAKVVITRNGVNYMGRANKRLLKILDADLNIVDYSTWFEAGPGNGWVWRDQLGNRIEYDANGRTVAYADRNGNRVTLNRDAEGRLLSLVDTNDDVALSYTWSPASTTDPETGEPISYQRITAVTDAFGRTVSYAYDPEGRIETVTDPLGHDWTYEYAATGFISSVLDPEGRRTSVSISGENGRLSSWFNGNGAGYRFDFAVGEVGITQTRTDGEGRTTQTQFNKLGLRTREIRGGETVYSIRHVTTADCDCFGKAGISRVSVRPPGVAAAGSASGRSTVSRFAGPQGSSTLRQRIVTDQRGRMTTSIMDARGNIVSVKRPDDEISTTEWHPVYAFPTRAVAVDGVVTEWDYDDAGNLTDVREAAGTQAERETQFEYDSHGNVTLIRYVNDPNTAEAIYRFTYDDRGNLLTRTDPLLGEQRFTDATRPMHDALGNAPVLVNERGKTWVFAFDAVGNLTQVTDPIGRQELYGYNLAGDLVTQTAANGGITTYTPNHAGLPLAIEDPIGRTTTFDYNRENQLERITNALGHSARTEYDPLGRILKSIDPNGNQTAFEYGVGLLRKTHFPTFSQELGYDELDRLVSEREVGNGLAPQLRRTEYDVFGSPDASEDALERRSSAEYDALRQLVATVDAIGGITRFAYDDRGNLLSLTDPENRTTRYGYDANDRRVSETRPNGAEWTWTYLPDGLPETATNPEGHVTEYVYDDAGQLLSTRFYESAAELASASPGKTVTFGYNLLGQLTDWDDGTYSATYGYNLTGELVTTTVDYGPFTKSHSYTYDDAGRKRTYTNPEGITYTYSYDRAGNFISLDIPGEGAITVNGYTWYAPNRRTYPGGITMDDVYDPLLRLIGREVRDAGGNLITSTVNEYNVENQLTDLSRDGFSTQYLYDGLDRLIEDTGNGERFTYDGVGNRLTEAGDPATWTYGANHELLATGTASYTYTAAGHRETKVEGGETWTYRYDLEERLVRIDSDIAGEIGRYSYGPMGRRLSKETDAGVVFFHYDQSGLLAEYDSVGRLLSEYQYAANRTWMTDPLFKRDGGVGIFYYLNSHIGAPASLISENGAVVWASTLLAFGFAQASGGDVVNNLRLPGQYFDSETDLHYNYFRDYDPSLGRYIQSDPIGLQGGLNTYAYVSGNPVNRYDFYGLKECDEDDPDCFDECLKDNYGDLYDQAGYFDPLALLSFAANEFAEYASDRIYREGLRNINSGQFRTGQRQLRTLAQFNRFNAAAALVGAGAFGFRRGAELYCAVSCL